MSGDKKPDPHDGLGRAIWWWGIVLFLLVGAVKYGGAP